MRLKVQICQKPKLLIFKNLLNKCIIANRVNFYKKLTIEDEVADFEKGIRSY